MRRWTPLGHGDLGVYSIVSSSPLSVHRRWSSSAPSARLNPEITQNPRALLGRPFSECSTMDPTIAGGATADYTLLYGDFSNYVVASRVGTRVEVVPRLMGANRRPTLQRGLILWGRIGAASVNDNAFRLLNAAS